MKDHHLPDHCPLEITLSLIDGKYKSLILWHLIGTTLRFSQLERKIPQATQKMLIQQLRELERDGLIHRHAYPVMPPRVEYCLSAFGQTLIPMLDAMCAWGQTYLEEHRLESPCSSGGEA